MDDPDEDWGIEEQTSCENLGGGGCNVRWILEKGINVGKKAVITGFVMSSAPVVLPPILVVSAVGLAFSLPFGLVFTGYACTQKLMSKLLPMPTASPISEYDQVIDNEMEEAEGRGEEGKYRIDLEREEKEQMDYVRAGVEERIELVKNENEVPQEEEDSKGIRGDMGREESTNEKYENRNDGMEREVTDLRIEESGPMRKDSKYDDVKPEVDRVVAVESGEHSGHSAIGEKENIGPVATGVVGECSRYQPRVTNEEEEIKRGSVGLLEKIKDLGNADDAARKPKKKRNKNKKTTSKGSAEMSLPDVKDQRVITKNLAVSSDVTENQQSEPEKRQNLEHSNEVGMQQRPVGGAVGSDHPRKSEESSDNAGKDSKGMDKVDFVEISVTTSRPKATDRDNSSEVDAVLPTEKEFVDEQKIWEQIDALRTIIGYKATPHRSSIEEVKALYVFAGVELPSSLGDQPDLAELGDKLRFLMSIVGIK